MRPTWSILAGALLALGACLTSPGDMSATQHDLAAAQEEQAAAAHEKLYRPGAVAPVEECGASHPGIEDGCWMSAANPTERQLREAREHLRRAAEHRRASAALRAAEVRACAGIPEHDVDTSPFEHTDQIAKVERIGAPGRAGGAAVTFKPMAGMTQERMQRLVDCQLARDAALGHVVPEMPDCPLVPRGVVAAVSLVDGAVVVRVTSKDAVVAEEIFSRAEVDLPSPATPAGGAQF